MTWLYALAGVWLAWILACWLSPLFLAGRRTTLVHVNLNLNPELDQVLMHERIEARVVHGLNEGYALSVWCGFRRMILVNEYFASFGLPDAKRFIIAHELGHHLMGHVSARLLLHMLFLHYMPWARRWMAMSEHHANRYAEQLTGLPSTVAWGPVVLTEIELAQARSMSGVTAYHRGTSTEENP